MYEDYYGFSGKPFQLTPDPRFFFASRGHNRALAYLRYGLSQSEGFIVVTGEIGTGKTTLVRMLCAELPEDEFVTAQIVTTQLSAEDTLRMVAQAFMIATDNANKSTLLSRIHTFFTEQLRRGRRVLLIVDEAQNLQQQALEELRMLSNFTVDGQPGLQTFLLGQAEFRQTMQSPHLEQFRQRVIAACHLMPLRQAEVRTYIEHRLKQAGWKERPQLKTEAFDAVFECTGGVPRRINTLLDRVLLFGFLEECTVIDKEAVQTVAEELRQELPMAQSGESTTGVAPAHTSEVLDNEFVSVNDLDRRVIALEHRMQSISSSLNKIMAFLRRFSKPRRPVDSTDSQ